MHKSNRNALLGGVAGVATIAALAFTSAPGTSGGGGGGLMPAAGGETSGTPTVTVAPPKAAPSDASAPDGASKDTGRATDSPSDQSSVSAKPTKTAKPTPVPMPIGEEANGHAKLRISATTKVDGLTVTLDQRVYGTVRAGEGAPAQTLWTEWHMGDGQQGGTDGGPMTCNPKLPLVHIDEDFDPFDYTYKKPGTYTITLKAAYCGDKGGALQTVTRTVTVGAQSTPAPTEEPTTAPTGDAGSKPTGPKVQAG